MENAVQVRNVVKSFGNELILDKINFTLRRNHVYGLIGPSGCGKTTLLKCIIGLLSLDDGEIRVFGRISNKPLGPRVGYMPQEISLISCFTILEVVHYFGKLFEMESNVINEKLDFFMDFLELNDKNKIISDCSGGQQRCISFIVSVLHDPKLIILDEPTVGMDPILREKVWDFIHEKVRTTDTSIIITTHYTEEARFTNIVGFMRKGILVAENNADIILQTLDTNSLDDTFIKLSEAQDRGNLLRLPGIYYNNEDQHSNVGPTVEQKIPGHILVLIWKNYLQIIHNKFIFTFAFTFFLALIPILYHVFWIKVVNLEIGIVDNKISSLDQCFERNDTEVLSDDGTSCQLGNVSCRFIKLIPLDQFVKIFYNNLDDAISDLKRSKIQSILNFPDISYSNQDNSVKKMDHRLEVYLDKSNYVISTLYSKTILGVYKQFLLELNTLCGYSKKSYPIEITQLYQIADNKVVIAPAGIFGMAFMTVSIQACLIFLTEKFDDILFRNMVAGVRMYEILIAQLIPNLLIAVIQVIQILLFIRFLYEYEGNGKIYADLFLLTFGLFFVAIGLGFVIAIICKSFNAAVCLTFFAMYTTLILGGLMWPIEAQPILLKKVTQFTPFSQFITASRYIMFKGASFDNAVVLEACFNLLIWATAFCVIISVPLLTNKCRYFKHHKK